jgi:hypothetical protein
VTAPPLAQAVVATGLAAAAAVSHAEPQQPALEESAVWEEAAPADDWFGMAVGTEVAAINDALVALRLAHSPGVSEELVNESSARFAEVTAQLVQAGRSRPAAEALVRKYAAASCKQRLERMETEQKRQQAILAHEAELRRIAEELQRAAAAERARLLEEQARVEALARRLRERKPVVHCFGGCNRTAFFWSPCSVAPRQIGWVDADGSRSPM